MAQLVCRLWCLVICATSSVLGDADPMWDRLPKLQEKSQQQFGSPKQDPPTVRQDDLFQFRDYLRIGPHDASEEEFGGKPSISKVGSFVTDMFKSSDNPSFQQQTSNWLTRA